MATTTKPPTKNQILRIYAKKGATPAAEAAGVSKRTVQRWAAKAGISSGYTAPVLRDCPSVASYNRGCRCSGCVAANKEASRQTKARRVARFENGEVEIEHGVSGYSNWDCRCETCRAEWSAYMRERRSGG